MARHFDTIERHKIMLKIIFEGKFTRKDHEKDKVTDGRMTLRVVH